MKTPLITIAASALLVSASSAQTLITGDANSVNITQMTYERNGSTIIQHSSATSTTATNDAIFLKNATIDDDGVSKNLEFFNFGGQVTHINLSSNVTGVGVSKSGALTSIENDGLGAFTNALQNTLNDTDINNYIYYDFVSGMPSLNVADYDIMFTKPFQAKDYIAVTERNGNTYFNLTPLDKNGNVIAGASVLQFNSSTGSLNTSGSPGGYDWNTGYASSTYVSNQPQWITIAKAGLFNTTTDIYGFRVDNNGEADVKFFGISDTAFVPEPSSAALLALGGLACLARRKRR